MRHFLLTNGHVELFLAFLIFTGRLFDVLGTLRVTPTLALEANPLIRRRPRTLMLLGFALCLVPFYSKGAGLVIAVASLLVAAGNLQRSWIAVSLGEAEMVTIMERAARQGSLRTSLRMLFLGGSLFALVAGVLFLLANGPRSPGYWFALGLLLYAVGVFGWQASFLVRLFKRVRHESEVTEAA